MSFKSPKRVSFSDQHSDKYLSEIQKENKLLYQRISELEEIHQKSQKHFNLPQENIEFIQSLLEEIKELKSINENNKQQIFFLQSENFTVLKENKKLRQENSDLNLKKMILENEVEKLCQTVYNQSIQLKKVNLAKNTQTPNPNYKSPYAGKTSERFFEDKPISRLSTTTTYIKNKRKRPEPTIGKMKTLTIQSMSCKHFGARSFSFTRHSTPTKAPDHLEELKQLIKHAKDSHSRHRSSYT